MSNDIPFTPLLINGQFRPASDGRTFETINAYSKKVVGRAAAATSQDCLDAVETAAKAFETWEQTPLMQRRDVFLKAADLMSTEKWQKKVLVTMKDEVSAVDPMLVFFNIPAVVGMLRHTAGLISHLKGETFPSDVPGGHVVSQRRGLGVVLAIAPWNVPMYLSMRAVMIPIICGNTVILKSSEITPRSQAIVGEIFKEAGLPDGVLNYICMDRADAPTLTKEIIAHPAVKKINFTGSDRVGKIIAVEAAKFLKPCVFELGGKCPVVVLDDADIDAAAKAIVSSALLHSGQICMSTERVIAQRKASEALVPAIQKLMSSLKAGEVDSNPLTALFTEAAAENVLNMLKDAQQQGAKILVGDIKREGAVIQPHLVVGAKPGMLIWERETFGPVATMVIADTIDEIVKLANKSDYSLNAALWTNDVHLAMEVGSRIRAGQTSINGPTIHVENMRGLTGLGGATGYGHFDIESFTDVRSLVFHSKAYRSYPVVG
ncbi:hypothetical protein QCA50_009049 [Cerrena zonata]|uniref:Aldehyde dehydrogenase domain-containing protein n=1 Tax=Cerrena zonata TaxID=2478898 RepID=A0AAW0G9L2_9APHY